MFLGHIGPDDLGAWCDVGEPFRNGEDIVEDVLWHRLLKRSVAIDTPLQTNPWSVPRQPSFHFPMRSNKAMILAKATLHKNKAYTALMNHST